MLNLKTIDPPLFEVLKDISALPEISIFSLVGGTALSLQIGHRKSDDLDFFTDRSFDVRKVKDAILRYNPGSVFLNETNLGVSFSLPLHGNAGDMRKLDIYNWAVKFIRPILTEGPIRLASLEDIGAFKLDAICHRKEKKDYIDIAVLLERFSFGDLIGFYREKFPMNDQRIVMTQILDTSGIENSVDPVMLVGLDFGTALQRIEAHVASFSEAQLKAKDLRELERNNRIADLINKKANKEPGNS